MNIKIKDGGLRVTIMEDTPKWLLIAEECDTLYYRLTPAEVVRFLNIAVGSLREALSELR